MTTTQNQFGMNVSGARVVAAGGSVIAGKRLGPGFETNRALLEGDATDSKTDAHLTALSLGITLCDFNVVLDTTKVTTMDQVRKMLKAAEFYYQGILTGP